MTLWVALETSSRAASIALGEGTHVTHRALAEQRAHASDLLPLLDELLTERSRAALDIDGIVIGTGPGSYTGLRVGIATALGLARAAGAALVAVPSLAALAFGELATSEQGLLVANAHAGALYFAHYARTAQDVDVLAEPCVAAPDEVRAIIEASSGRILADAMSTERLELRSFAAERLTVGALPKAQALLELGTRRFATRGASSPDEIEPLYLRPFQAKPRKR